MRAVHQDAAKSFVVDHLSGCQVPLIMDWAMKFLPISFRETQRDWFGKTLGVITLLSCCSPCQVLESTAELESHATTLVSLRRGKIYVSAESPQ